MLLRNSLALARKKKFLPGRAGGGRRTTAAAASAAKNKMCTYYSRFGKCLKLKTPQGCPFEHDPAKVRVCSKFLRGTCTDDDCPFSHTVAAEKMPVCHHFLRGTCSKDPCPYLHVKLNDDAAICEAFARDGYCPDGADCRKKHVHSKREKKTAPAARLPPGGPPAADRTSVTPAAAPPTNAAAAANDPGTLDPGRQTSSGVSAPSSFLRLGKRIGRGGRGGSAKFIVGGH